MAGRRGLGELPQYLARADSHPPLDYLIRAPLARVGASDFWLRTPSIVFSVSALVLLAWWMRDRGWFGLIATTLFSFSAFQVLYGGEARMYALLQLLGVAAAVIAEQWLRAPRTWHSVALGALVFIGLLDHMSALLLGLGLLALCGMRTDGDGWRLRGCLAAAGAAWAVLWLPMALEQLDHSWSSWIPRTSPSYFADVVAQQFVTLEGRGWFALVTVVAGGVLLVRRDRVLGRLWLACGAVPFLAAAVIGVFHAFLLPRTLTLASWAPVLAVAFLLDAVLRRWKAVGLVAIVTVCVVVLATTASFLAFKRWDYDLSIDKLQQSARPGDVVAVRPARYGILADWRIGVHGDRPTRRVRVAGIDDVNARVVLGGEPSGRVWLLTAVGSRTLFEGFVSCAAPWTDDVTTIVCLQRR
jgi:hypothetical protein